MCSIMNWRHIYNHSCSTGNTHQETDPKTASSESLEDIPNQEEIATTASSSNTHIEPNKSEDSSSKAHITQEQLTLF